MHPLSELRTPEEVSAAENGIGEVNNKEIEGEVNPNAVEQFSKPVTACLIEADERPYFHVQPLNGAELENWHNCLDFIEGGGDFNK
ncbi:hypothetical protein Tco_0074867, partial [Tanacetum coccineum]